MRILRREGDVLLIELSDEEKKKLERFPEEDVNFKINDLLIISKNVLGLDKRMLLNGKIPFDIEPLIVLRIKALENWLSRPADEEKPKRSMFEYDIFEH